MTRVVRRGRRRRQQGAGIFKVLFPMLKMVGKKVGRSMAKGAGHIDVLYYWRAKREERLSRSKLKQAFLIHSDAEFFMFLIQCIRFGS